MTPAYIYSFADLPTIVIFLVICIILAPLALNVLCILLSPVIWLVFFLYYTARGRRKEFLYRIANDPKFLTFDKYTGKFIS